MPSKTAAGAREIPGGAAAYLRAQGLPAAARIMGSRERAEAVLNGAPADKVINAGKDPLYRLARVGGPVGHALVENVGVSSAYEIAKAGGTHAGLIRRYGRDTTYAISKSARSLERIIESHQAKIANPQAFVTPGTPASEVRYLVDSKWPKEISGLRQELDVLRGILAERGDGER